MNTKITKAVRTAVALASFMSAGMANAFVLNEDLGNAASSTDVWKIVCPASVDPAFNTASVRANITDMANVMLPPLMPLTIFKGGFAITTTDPVDALQGGVSLPSPTVTLVQGSGTYYINIAHTQAGSEAYAASGECQNQFGVPLAATSVVLVQDQ